MTLANGDTPSCRNDKVIVVTGESSGIGRAAALRLASRGDKVLVTVRWPAPLEQIVAPA